ncbi:hypothetical protein AgCh_000520 [Apium graveolens]
MEPKKVNEALEDPNLVIYMQEELNQFEWKKAWELWRTDRVLELIDSNLELPASFLPLRFIHVGILCVQESPANRPTMSDGLAMLKLVSPKRPALCLVEA